MFYALDVVQKSLFNKCFLKIIFQVQPPRLDLPPEESTDLEELEQFAKMFKQKRIKLGKNLQITRALWQTVKRASILKLLFCTS